MKTKVFSKKTGNELYVPEHWVNHPVLGKGFTTKRPTQKGGHTVTPLEDAAPTKGGNNAAESR